MRKKLILFLMLALFGSTSFLRADELTVHDGTTTNANVPVYGYYCDAYLKAEMIYPATELTAMNGLAINAMTFYASQTSVSWGSASFEVYLNEVSATTISDFIGTDGATLVYSGDLSIADGEMTVTFATPYEYAGGNLLVCVYNAATGDYVSSTWYGEEVTGASFSGYSYSSLASVTSGYNRDFLPKTTFSYSAGGGGGGGSTPLVNPNVPEFEAWVMGDPDVEMSTLELLYPTDGEMNVLNPIYLQWTTDPNAAEYMIEFGSTYPPEVLVDWTAIDETYPANPSYYEVTDLIQPNTHYFWRISIRNNVNTLTSDLWGFTTLMDIPEDVTATPAEIFTDETTVISWTGNSGSGGGGGGVFGEVFLGDGGTSTSNYLPTYILYNYSLTQQIYTADEIGGSGTISSLSFYYTSGGSRTADIYMVNTDKASFASGSDWITVTAADRVYSGSWDPTAGTWYTVNLDTPFQYNGSGNLAIIFDDNTGTWTSSIPAYVYSAGGQAIRVYSDGTNYDPFAPTGYAGTVMDEKNQIYLNKSDAKGERSLRGYNVYVDGAKVNDEVIAVNNYTLEGLTYEVENGHSVQVTSVHDEGESFLSDEIYVYVSGYGEFTGTVTEDMSGDPLQGVQVTLKGTDEFGNETEYEATTDSDGIYTIEDVKAGVYTFGRAKLNGYEPRFMESSVTLAYNTTATINFTLHVVYTPVTQVYAYEMDETTVKVQWSFNNFTPYVPGTGGGGGQGGSGDTFTESWDSSLNGWTNIDNDGDGHMWYHSSEAANHSTLAITSHGGSGHLMGESFCNAYGALTPDDYLVSPQKYGIVNGSTLTFWGCAQDASWASEHFGVAISTTGNTSASDFTTIQEWTLTAKGNGAATIGREGKATYEGNWYQYTCDLSSYAGQQVWIAIRHFNCTDMFIMCLDDMELSTGSKNAANPIVFGPASEEYDPSEELNAINGEMPENMPVQRGNRDDVLYEPLYVTDPGAMANGADASWLKGSQSTFGPGAQHGVGNIVADDFTLTSATTITEIEVYAYQTGSSTTSTLTGLYAVIYDGNPMDGANIIWGDMNTNIMTDTYFTNCYRGSANATTGTTRPIMAANASGLSIDLPAGTYYLAWNMTGSLSSGPWAQPEAVPTDGNTGNGVQYLSSSSAWQNLTDTGAGTSYGAAFSVIGTNNAIVGADGLTYRLWKKTIVAETMPDPDSITLAEGVTDTIYADFTWFDDVPGLYQFGVQAIYPVPSAKGTRANRDEELTVNDGTSTNSYVPVYGFYCDAYLKCEMVYPADDLADMEMGTINSMKFYASTGSASWGSANFQVFMTEVDATSISAFTGPDAATVVYEGPLSISGNEMNVEFSTPYAYNGGNLLIGFYNMATGSYVSCSWLGVTANGASVQGYSYSSLGGVSPTQRNFLPKTTFYYEPSAGSNDDPETPVTWSNVVPKYMETSLNLNASVNTGSIEGAEVTFTNLYEDLTIEETLDETGTLSYDEFRKGEYNLTIELAGYDTYNENVSIWSDTTLVITLAESFLPVDTIIVSSTGFARWTDMLPTEAAQRYHVTLEGALQGVTTDSYMQLDVADLIEGETYTAAVAVVYTTGMSEFKETYFTYLGCESVVPQIDTLWADIEDMNITLQWNEGGTPTPTPPPTPGAGSWEEGFESGIPSTWATIDADGDGYNWEVGTNTAHTGSGYVTSASYINYYGALTPDNYLVTPACEVADGTTFSFYAGAQDANYAAEHFGVAVSTGSQTNVADFTTIQEWTLTAKYDGPKNPRGMNTQGNYYEYSVDLSSYAGQTVYIAIRHFNCTDWFMINVDDVAYTVPAKSGNETADLSGSNIPVAPADEVWDFLGSFSAAEGGQYGIASDGEYCYTSNWGYSGATHNFYKYDMDGNVIEGFDISGSGTIRDLTYDGQYFYGVANSAIIYCLDFDNHSVVSTINSSYGAMRCCSYDATRDGFWVVGNWSGNLSLVDRTGAVQITGPAPTSASGVAYYKDDDNVEHVLVFCQPASDCQVYDYNIATNTLSSSPVFNFSSNTPGCTGSSGGCHVANYNDKLAFFGNSQQSPNLIGIYELGTAQGGGHIGATSYTPNKFNILIDGVVVGATSETSYLVTAPDYAPHLYEVVWVDADYNISCPMGLLIEIEHTSVSESSDVVNAIYPNPTNGNLFVKADNMVRISVVNALGQVVYDQAVSGNETILNMARYEAGMYLVNVVTENGTSVKRIIVTK